MGFDVTVFEEYPFVVGQKIRIGSGSRKGDWEVVEVGDKKVTLRCPLSGTEVKWVRFCYCTDEKKNEQWPLGD